MSGEEPIYVTRPFLPPREEFDKYVDQIWSNKVLTNQGPLAQRLESELKKTLRLDSQAVCVANGGLALQIAIKALGVRGKVVTTPYSYVATTSCLLWEDCWPVYADIDPVYLTIDAGMVETLIDSNTEAIVATHVFGTPCDVIELQRIASKYGIALIYDAAHAFGVEFDGRSVLHYGDASIVSMHSTKLIHAVEAGFLYSPIEKVTERAEWMRRFGHTDNDSFKGVGINAKLSEFHAAMGLANLAHLDEIIGNRERLFREYEKLLDAADIGVRTVPKKNKATRNFSYFPLIFQKTHHVEGLLKLLAQLQIYPRRYFRPSLNTSEGLSDCKQVCAVSESVADRIVCLPLSSAYTDEECNRLVSGLGAALEALLSK